MFIIKDNSPAKYNHLNIELLTINNRYKFQTMVLRKFFTNTKLAYIPLLMGNTHTNKSTVFARFLCILSIKRISKGASEHKQLKVCLHVH
jgi:hypothetical protein